MEVLLTDFNQWLPMGGSLRWIHTGLGKTALIRTFPSNFPVFALDRIWVSPSSSPVEICAVRDAVTRAASDHLPLRTPLRRPESGQRGR